MTDAEKPVSASYRLGLETMYRLGGKELTDSLLARLAEICPALGDRIVTTIYGDLHQRTGLEPAERELITLVALASLGGCEAEIRLHTVAGLGAGLTPERIVEALLHLAAYAGTPRALNAVMAVREAMVELGLLPASPATGPFSL